MRKRFSTYISILLVITLMFTLVSCKDKAKKNEAIKAEVTDTIDTYFKYLSQNKISKLSKCVYHDSYFEEDEYKEFSDILDKYLSNIEYEIVDIAPNTVKAKNATATIEVTRIDITGAIDSYIDEIEDSTVPANVVKKQILKIISEKNVKTTTEQLIIKMCEDGEGWLIQDDDKIYDFVMKDFSALDTIVSLISNTKETTPTEDPTSKSTEISTEATTTTENSSSTEVTTTDEATTTSADDPDESLPETKPHPGLVKKHIVDLETAMKILKNHGYELDTESDLDEEGFFTQSADNDFFVMYIKCPDSETLKENYIDELDDLLYGDLYINMGTVTDQWNRNTHNMYSKNNTAYKGSSIDLYIYYDEDTLSIVGIEELPQADPPEDFYIIIEELGLWDFGISID